MAIPFEPWMLYPSLTAARLRGLGGILQGTRDGVIDISSPDDGDSPWSIGCRVYDRTLFRLTQASLTWDWLKILPETHRLRLTFTIGDVPVKLYKGEPDEVPPRTLVRSYSELKQMQLAFKKEGIDVEASIRIAVEADSSGRTTSITLVEVDAHGKPSRVYDIPLSGSNLVEMVAPVIDLPAPKIELLKPTEKENEIEGNSDALGIGGKP